jgi:hypothetical protein
VTVFKRMLKVASIVFLISIIITATAYASYTMYSPSVTVTVTNAPGVEAKTIFFFFIDVSIIWVF